MPDPATPPASGRVIYRVSELSPRRPVSFALAPGTEELRALAAELGLQGLRKLRFAGRILAEGGQDWRVEAHLGATVTQSCVATLEPVTTRIEEDVTRRFLRDWPPAEEEGDEVEMPPDDTIERLGAEIDLAAVMREALALALPPYPRSRAAAPVEFSAAPPGAAPLDEAAPRPFAGLEALKKKLRDDGG